MRASGLGVSFDFPPSHFPVALCRFQELFPQISIRYRLLDVVEPSVLSPLFVPAPLHAVDEVGRVGVDGYFMSLINHL